jgi:hypothetical protein
MNGHDCDAVPEWWETPRVELQRANLSYARDLDAHHERLHPGKPCVRQIAAAAYIAGAEQCANARETSDAR